MLELIEEKYKSRDYLNLFIYLQQIHQWLVPGMGKCTFYHKAIPTHFAIRFFVYVNRHMDMEAAY